MSPATVAELAQVAKRNAVSEPTALLLGRAAADAIKRAGYERESETLAVPWVDLSIRFAHIMNREPSVLSLHSVRNLLLDATL